MKWALRLGLLALLAVGVAANAKADSTEYSYVLTGPGTDVRFDLPASPTPSNATLTGTTGMGIFVTPTNLFINGSPSSDVIEFFNISQLGGIEDDPPLPTDPTAPIPTPAFNLTGPQLYSGDETGADIINPLQMSLGTFTLDDYTGLYVDDPSQVIPYTLVVSTVPTPEPSSLLLLGMGLTGLLLVRKRYAAN